MKLEMKQKPDAILLDSSDGQDPDRLARLNQAIGWITAVSSALSMDPLQSITRLCDWKGTLQVTWREEPSELEKGVLEQAWSVQNECAVDHTWERLT